jgi:hypothetical protein
MPDWTFHAGSQPRLIWLSGNKLTEFNTSLAGILDSDKQLPTRPELDMLLALLRYSMERVKAAIEAEEIR